MRGWLLLVLALSAAPSWAAHAYAQFGDIKYPPGFTHFSYVNPNAPKGGEIRMVPPTRPTNFDKFNPFTLKGTAPSGLGNLMFESLLTGNSEEPTTAYGLLAEDVEVAPDKRSRHLPHPSQGALQRRLAGAGGRCRALLHHAHRAAGGAPVPHDLCRGEGRQGHRRAHGALRLRQPQSRTAAGGGRHGGVQPRLGRGQAFRPGHDRGTDRLRPLQDRQPAHGPRHHLHARSELLGRRASGAQGLLQLRSRHLQDLPGRHLALRRPQGRRVRLHARVHFAQLGAPVHGQAVRRRARS